MSRMFNNAIEFNQPINGWDTSNVTDMTIMFTMASVFKKEYIRGWDTSNVNVNDKFNMFAGADSYTYQ